MPVSLWLKFTDHLTSSAAHLPLNVTYDLRTRHRSFIALLMDALTWESAAKVTEMSLKTFASWHGKVRKSKLR